MLCPNTPPELLVPALTHPLLAKRKRSTVYRWLVEGRIDSLRIGGLHFTTDEAVKAFIVSCNETPIRKRAKKVPQAQRRAEIGAAMARFQPN